MLLIIFSFINVYLIGSAFVYIAMYACIMRNMLYPRKYD